jgi:chromosome segregation ATPase
MKCRVLVVSMLVSGLAGGCANAPTDPREGGLAGGLAGLQSGAYEARVREREERLERLRAVQAELETERAELDALQQTREQQVAAERARLRQMDTEVADLSRSVDDLAGRYGNGDQRIRDLQARLAALQGGMRQQQSSLDALEGIGPGGGSDPAVDLRRQQLEEQRRALEREYQMLLDLSLELAR